MVVTLDREMITEEPSNLVDEEQVNESKKRMLLWENPVEFINNMYSAHPGEFMEYFEDVFGK